jgi:hypothetical protein
MGIPQSPLGNSVGISIEDDSVSSNTSFSIKSSDFKTSQLHRGAEKRGGLSKLKTRYQVQILIVVWHLEALFYSTFR